MKAAAIACFILLTLALKAQYAAVQLPNTMVHAITTPAGKNYTLYIKASANMPADAKYPVLYVLDGQWNFASAASFAESLYEDGAIPALIVVGITWPGEKPDYDSLRQAAFTPNASETVSYGGNAGAFLTDIQQAIIPFVDSAYHTNTADRILDGGSLGCLFAAYTLLHAPAVFNAYILGSPTLEYDNDTMHKQFAHYRPAAGLHPKIFIGLGDEDRYLPNTNRFLQILKQPQFAGFNITVERLNSTSHATGILQSISNGLHCIFKKPVITITPAALQAYAGVYGKDTTDNFTLYINNGHLAMKYDANVTFTLLAENRLHFNVRGLAVSYQFTTNTTGKITGVTLQYQGGERYYDKVK